MDHGRGLKYKVYCYVTPLKLVAPGGLGLIISLADFITTVMVILVLPKIVWPNNFRLNPWYILVWSDQLFCFAQNGPTCFGLSIVTE